MIAIFWLRSCSVCDNSFDPARARVSGYIKIDCNVDRGVNNQLRDATCDVTCISQIIQNGGQLTV